MASKMISVHVLLPNGKRQQLKIRSGKNWQASLREGIMELYPRSSTIRFVEELPKKPLSAGKPFKSNVMFQVRKNYYTLGHITARLPE